MFWITGWCECSICLHRQVFVIESEVPRVIVNLECAGCGNMTSHPIDEPEEPKVTLYKDANDPNDPEDLDEFVEKREQMKCAACCILCLLALCAAVAIAAAVLS